MAQVNGNSNHNNLSSDLDVDDMWQEIEIPVPWGIVAGKWWGPRNNQPILAVHGWQDNAGSFDRLCPLLLSSNRDLSILCIDLPGHGRSSHYPKGMHYFLFWDGITLIRRIVKHYNWQQVTLMGHSLGGALSFMYAASFPDEIEKFISIDIAGPTVRDHKKNAKMTGDCIDKFLKYEDLPIEKMPCYKYEEMIELVLQAYVGSVNRESAEILMKRGMNLLPPTVSGEERYNFSRDARLKISLMGMFSLEQVQAYAVQIKCEVLNIRGIPGMIFENSEWYSMIIEETRKNAKRVVYEEVEGTHHLHLNTPERIVKIIENFIN